MHLKKILLLFLVSVTAISMAGCSDKNKNEVDINLPVNTPTPIVTETPTVEPTVKPTPSVEPTQVPEMIVVETNTYRKQVEERQYLIDFQEQLKILLEDNLFDLYKSHELGTSIKDIVTDIESKNLRFINNVTLDYLEDEFGVILDMKDRKGLIVFSSSNLDIEEETARLCNIENYDKAKSTDLIIDSRECDFDSFIVFTFNTEGKLVGKFKNLLTEKTSAKLDLNKISGSLNFNENYALKIDETSSNKDVYEKIDYTRSLINEYNKQMENTYNTCFNHLKELYDNTTFESTTNDLALYIKDKDLGIEKMPQSTLDTYNKKYNKEYTNAYYIYMALNEEKSSPDLRYNNTYMVVILDDKDKAYYIEMISEEYNDIKCEDEKNADDYSLSELYNLINDIDKKINEILSEKSGFMEYLDKNINLLNSKITFDMKKSDILKEIQISQLTYTEDTDSYLTTGKDSNNNTIALQDVYNNNIYTDYIKVATDNKEIYYFFINDDLFAINRNTYFDVKDVDIKNYYNLNLITKGLSQVLEKENKYKTDKQLYLNMVNKKLSDFINTIGYSSNHSENQLYRKVDILRALSTSGFKYEEGMNKGDKLYFIGIYTLKTDTKYSYKIYFNSNQEVELIQ